MSSIAVQETYDVDVVENRGEYKTFPDREEWRWKNILEILNWLTEKQRQFVWSLLKVIKYLASLQLGFDLHKTDVYDMLQIYFAVSVFNSSTFRPQIGNVKPFFLLASRYCSIT